MSTSAWLVGGCLLAAYIIGSYILMYRDLKRNAGPGGLGWMGFPAAPLMGPLLVWMAFKSFIRRVFS